jgi:hypothetical protein
MTSMKNAHPTESLIMTNRRLIILLTCTIVLTVIGCREKKIEKSKRYSFEMQTWGFSGLSFEVLMYNTDIPTYPPNRRGGIQFDENTLYILKHKRSNDETSTDTLAIRLTNEQVDSLFALAYRYLSNFEIDNKVEIGKVKESIQDGASLKVSLGYDGKLMECSQYRLKGVSQSSIGGPELVAFINRQVPGQFRLY